MNSRVFIRIPLRPMLRTLLKSRSTASETTHCELHYEGLVRH